MGANLFIIYTFMLLEAKSFHGLQECDLFYIFVFYHFILA